MLDSLTAMLIPQVEKYLPFISRHLNSPSFGERIEIALLNVPALLALVLCLFFLYKGHLKLRVFWTTLLLVNLVVKASAGGYTYDTPFASLCIIADLYLVYRCFRSISYLFFREDRSTLGGLALTCLAASCICTLGIHRFLPSLTFWNPLVLTLLTLYFIWNGNSKDLNYFELTRVPSLSHLLFISIVIALPLLPYTFSPAPPDADITTMADLLGYLYQGELFHQLHSGVPDEVFFIRYPNGFPSLGLFISEILNIRGAEAMLLLWLISHFFLVINIWRLTRTLKIPYLGLLLFTLVPTFTDASGLHGGQAQECLAYALGIGFMIECFEKRYRWAPCYLGAAALVQPIVAIPFFIVGAGVLLRDLWQLHLSRSILLSFGAVGLYIIIYFSSLVLGHTDNISQPQMLLQELNLPLFFQHLINWIKADSQGMPWIYLIFLLPITWHTFGKRTNMIMLGWLASALFIDGVWGSTKWSIRLHASYSSVAIWIMTLGMTVKLISNLIESRRSRGAPQQAYPLLASTILAIYWLLTAAPGFPLIPVSVFTTHADIRLGRFLAENTKQDSLIANIRPPGDHPGFGFMTIANSSRKALHTRLGDHQIKSGAYNSAFRSSVNKCLETKSALSCLKKIGITHIVLDDRSGSGEFAKTLSTEFAAKFGSAYVIEIGLER